MADLNDEAQTVFAEVWGSLQVLKRGIEDLDRALTKERWVITAAKARAIMGAATRLFEHSIELTALTRGEEQHKRKG